MTEQHALSVVIPIKHDMVEPLRQLLADIVERDVEDNITLPYKRLDTIHFSRWVVIDSTNEFPAQLAFATNYDAPLSAHLQQLISVAGEGLRQILLHCEGFPENAAPEQIRAFIERHRLPTAAFYIGTRGRSVTQIERESELRERIGAFLDASAFTRSGSEPAGAQSIRAAIQQFVSNETSLAWAMKPEAPPTTTWKIRHYGYLVLLITMVLAVLIVPALFLPWYVWPLIVAGSIGALIALLRLHEQRDARTDKAEALRLSETLKQRISELANREDHVVQNQLTHLVDVKPGLFRQVTLRAVLFAINTLATYVFNKGQLGDIPSIHFARWVLIDGGRRLLFFSNFDGSWENYLGDFIDKAAKGLTAVWSNTAGFPATRFLAYDGATDEQHFKTWARVQQIATDVWYSAYKSLTVQNINNNSAIRAGLWGTMDEQAAQEWLRRF